VRADTGKTVYRVSEYTGDRLAPADNTVREK
jgi:hypothetical protein